MSDDGSPLILLRHATITRSNGLILREIDWTIREGETWAITGPMGSGKSTLAETILGRHRVASGEIDRPLLSQTSHRQRTTDAVRLVAFREESRLFSPAKYYYQQRFNFIDPIDDLSLEEFLRATADSANALHAMARHFGLERLLPLSFLKLSHGQSRRARLAQALLAKPELLIIDDPFLGLDKAARDELAGMLGSLVKAGTRLLLVVKPGTMPTWVTHVLELRNGRVHGLGPRTPRPQPLSPAGRGETKRAETRTGRGEINGRAPRLSESKSELPIIQLTSVTVAYSGQPILNDVSWSVGAGEKWAVLGPNGAGKTTLLSLLCGDHPQAYANDVRLFGQRRGSGESIWDIKRKVGLLSPELHVYFTEPLTAERVAATGFSDTMTPRLTSPEQDETIRSLFREFGLAAIASRPFAQLSAGEQRLVLFVRAVAKNPPLLILDEPFQGLDDSTISRARDWLDLHLREDQTLLFVTHHEEEIPRCVTRRLRLDQGRIVQIE